MGLKGNKRISAIKIINKIYLELSVEYRGCYLKEIGRAGKKGDRVMRLWSGDLF